MRLVTALIKPFKLEEVKEAIVAIAPGGLTVTEARGFGRQRGHNEVYRGTEYTIEFIPKVRVEVLTEDMHAEEVAAAIADAARTGSIGDGKVWITPVDSVIRVRTGERDADAL